MIFSWRNMALRRNSMSGVPPIIGNAWGMDLGAIGLLALIDTTRQLLIVLTGPSYLTTLVYLAVFASMIDRLHDLPEACHTSLVCESRLCHGCLSYCCSGGFHGVEYYQWKRTAVLGVAMTLLGNIVMSVKLTPSRTDALQKQT